MTTERAHYEVRRDRDRVTHTRAIWTATDLGTHRTVAVERRMRDCLQAIRENEVNGTHPNGS